MLTQEWNIQSRALQCAVSGRPFAKDERVYSALYWRDGEYTRVDLSAEAWNARNENIKPLSVWQSDFVPPAPPAPEPLKKDDAESLLRRLMAAHEPATRNARYILALMLERKRILRQIERQRGDGAATLVYEHLPTGEVWLIEDPGLKLGELKAVQDEVAHLLSLADSLSAQGAPEAPVPSSETPG
ncbi:MAG TPA: hypothetical protein VL981_09945 [Candidatus Methylacidiphilales bacterium]|nr:hypothetical protein [Candidatus Methylacidiphilales bacterium]